MRFWTPGDVSPSSFAVNFPSQAGTIFGVNPHMFRSFLDQQSVFVFFMSVWAGAGLIANDRRANALQIYLAKPLTRTEYILGKLSVLLAFLLSVTLVPGLLLLIMQVAFSGSFAFLTQNAALVPAVILSSTFTASRSMMPLACIGPGDRCCDRGGVLVSTLIARHRIAAG